MIPKITSGTIKSVINNNNFTRRPHFHTKLILIVCGQYPFYEAISLHLAASKKGQMLHAPDLFLYSP